MNYFCENHYIKIQILFKIQEILGNKIITMAVFIHKNLNSLPKILEILGNKIIIMTVFIHKYLNSLQKISILKKIKKS